MIHGLADTRRSFYTKPIDWGLFEILEGDGEVTNEDMGALNGDDVEGVDQLQGAAALVPTSSSTAAAVVRLFKFNASLSLDQKLCVCTADSAVFLSICDSTDLLLLLMMIIQMCFILFSLKFDMTASSTDKISTRQLERVPCQKNIFFHINFPISGYSDLMQCCFSQAFQKRPSTCILCFPQTTRVLPLVLLSICRSAHFT